MKSLLKALLAAQAEIKNPVKDSKNPHFKNNYASLESVLDAVLEPLHKHGLVLTQTIGTSPTTSLITTLWHADSGEFIESIVPLNPVKTDPQGYAAACTYYRRMSIKSFLGLAEVDDDGNEASAPKPAPARAVAMVREKMAPESDISIIEVAAGMREAKTLKDLETWAAHAKNLAPAEKADARAIYAQRKSELEGL